MSVTTSIGRPRSASVCQAEARRARSATARSVFSAIRSRSAPASASCCSSGTPSPAVTAPAEPEPFGEPRPHPLQRNTSPLTTLKAWLRAAWVVAAHSRCLASRRASVISVSLVHCAEEPGNKKAARFPGRSRRRPPRSCPCSSHCRRRSRYRVRPVYAPAEAVALGRGEHLVFLGVVEILNFQPRPGLRETASPAIYLCHRPRTARDNASSRSQGRHAAPCPPPRPHRASCAPSPG